MEDPWPLLLGLTCGQFSAFTPAWTDEERTWRCACFGWFEQLSEDERADIVTIVDKSWVEWIVKNHQVELRKGDGVCIVRRGSV